MVTMAQRIEELRTERGLSRPAFCAALGFPKTAAEKFETGRQTPTQDQQQKMASFFGVSLFYLRGETNDRTQMENWLNMSFTDEAPAPKAPPRPAAPKTVAQSGGTKESGAVFNALLASKSFQDVVKAAVLDVLRTPEGEELLRRAVRKELNSGR